MRIPKIYLETTMFNHYFDTNREAHVATVQLFEEIRSGKYEAYTSLYVTDELGDAPEPKRTKMLALIQEYGIVVLPDDSEAETLADIYVSDGVIPERFRYDGLHIAVATINDIEYIFSLNYQHINKLKTKSMTGVINESQGYRPVKIVNPMEVV